MYEGVAAKPLQQNRGVIKMKLRHHDPDGTRDLQNFSGDFVILVTPALQNRVV